MKTKFTEKDTEIFYDQEDEIYRSFWDKNGSLHWGFFDKENINFLSACQNLTDIMIDKSDINYKSTVLDVGCGNGETTIYIANKCNCKITGIDLSGVRIKNAVQKLKSQSENHVQFIKSSATALPFKNNFFSNIWSQATIYHVHDKEKALREIYRVLDKNGTFIFDDLLKPKNNISPDSQKYVYDRLLFDTPFSFASYKDYLEKVGFAIIESTDISLHLKKSYDELVKILEKKLFLKDPQPHHNEYKKLIFSYQKMSSAVDKHELGWGMYLCKKK